MRAMLIRACVRWPTLVLVGFFLVSCKDDPEPTAPADDLGSPGELANATTGGATDPAAVCTPLHVQGCSPDFKAEIRCNEAGLGWETVKCKNDQGEASICHVDTNACLPCTPGDKRCKNDDMTEICAEDGSGWQDAESCNGTQTGQTCQTGSCISLCEQSLKWNTYMGCEYWAADLDNGFWVGGNNSIIDGAGSTYAVMVSNPNAKYPLTVEIHDSDGLVTFGSDGKELDLSPIGPMDLRVFKLPRRDVNGTVLAPLAYRISTSLPATVHQFNPLSDEEVYSNDASLLLPINVLDRWYYVMSRRQSGEKIRAYLTVIGTRVDTEVIVTVSAKTLAADDIPSLNPGDSITRTLQPFDVLNIETNGSGEDLTGSVVVATRDVAVFGGHEGAGVPSSDICDLKKQVCEFDGETACESDLDCGQFWTCCLDHIEQQMYPVSTWGQQYHCARTKQRNSEKEYWRIMAAKDNTKITTVPAVATIPVLNAGEWFEFGTEGDFELTATAPVMVGQFMAAEQAPEPGSQPGDAGVGDPAFMLVVPFEQYRSDYVFLTPPDYDKDYVNVVAPPGANVTLDGQPVGNLKPFGTGAYLLARLPVVDGVHAIVSDKPVGILVYGFDQYVSYGYPGGLDLKRLDLIEQP